MDVNEKTTHRLMCENKGAYGDLIFIELVCARNVFILDQVSHSKSVEDKSILATSLEENADILQSSFECRDSAIPIF
jgi:hypothetical protein